SKPSSFLLKGKSADVFFSKIEQPNQKPAYDIDSLTVNDEVQVEYGKGYILHADKAFYEKETKAHAKHISVSCQEQKKCTLLHENDKVFADTMNLDVAHSSLSMLNPKGILKSFFINKHPEEQVQFSSESLTWDHLLNQISLIGDVKFEDPSLGFLTSDREIQIIQKGGQ